MALSNQRIQSTTAKTSLAASTGLRGAVGTPTFSTGTPSVPTAPPAGGTAQGNQQLAKEVGLPIGGAVLAAGGAFLGGLALPFVAVGAGVGAIGGWLLSKKV